MSAAQSPPKATATARSSTILPGSCTANGSRHGANRLASNRSNLVTRAACTNSTAPAEETNNAPPAITRSHGRNRILFTHGVPSYPRT